MELREATEADLPAILRLDHDARPVTWRLLAKDGAVVPARLAQPADAVLQIASGETYDFAFRPSSAGEFRLEIENPVNKAKLIGRIIVQGNAVASVAAPR